jgi:glycosyltransferase involved in cell wall biosynthesis
LARSAERPVPKVSLILATYEWPQALDLVLHSACRQTWPNLEIIVADDGSGLSTRRVVEAWRKSSPHPIVHAWQRDLGFRLARSRNMAVARATGDYLLMLDGDCLLFPGFVARHMRDAQRGWFTAGRRCFLRRRLSAWALAMGLPLHLWPKAVLFPLLLLGGGTRAAQLLPLPQTDAGLRARADTSDQAQGCNLGLWRTDFRHVGGFDERFEAWGGEDTDLVERLLASGVRRLTLQHAEPVLHLWHPRRSGQTPAQTTEALEPIRLAS